MTLSTNGKFTSTKQLTKKKTNFRYCSPLFAQTMTSRSSVNSAKQAGHLFSPQSSLVILYANGMYGMLASAHDSQMLLRNIRESIKMAPDFSASYQPWRDYFTFALANPLPKEPGHEVADFPA